MASTLDCVICLLKQSLDAARYATNDENVEREILERSMKLLLERGLTTSPPVIGTEIHRIVRDAVGNPDPYFAEKKRFNRAANAHYERLRGAVAASDDPFGAAVRLAIAGNSIDFALGPLDEKAVETSILQALETPLNGSLEEFKAVVRDAETILYLGDNAGEIALDKLLVERLISAEYRKDVAFVVRGKPILNDALLDDAEEVGMTALTKVISNGSDGLGVHFDLTSPEFNDAFRSADLVIAKGLANYETLFDGKGPILPKKIAFLFKAKCPFIAQANGAKLGDLVVRVRA